MRAELKCATLLQGLSEPVGALIALLFVKPFLTPNLLQYMLAFVGGIMVRSCLHLCFCYVESELHFELPGVSHLEIIISACPICWELAI